MTVLSDYEVGCALGAALGIDAWRADPADVEQIGSALRPVLEDMAGAAADLVEVLNALPVNVIAACLPDKDGES